MVGEGVRNTYMPQTPMMRVALRRDVTKGARTMEPANTPCETVHAVRREGLNFSMLSANEASLAGGRAVKRGSASSGLLTTKGSKTDMMNVIIEKPIKANEPMRPT
jgi:hypothetical protein